MKNKIITKWYVFTDHSYTNEVIARELPPENAYSEVVCADNIKRDLWICEGSFVTKLIKNKKSQNLQFHIYNQKGKYGKIHKSDFLKKPKKKD